MGTRGAFGFRLHGKDKVTYNHFDSYPDGLGADVIRFVMETDDEQMKSIAKKIKLVDERKKPTKKQIDEVKHADRLSSSYRLNGLIDVNVSEQSEQDWYCLLRGAQGSLEHWKYLDLKYMIDSHDFLKDSLFCEWAYIINLDEGYLEVYKGFNKDPKAKGRYAALDDHDTKNPDRVRNQYYGVAEVIRISLAKLRGIYRTRTPEYWIGFIDALSIADDEEAIAWNCYDDPPRP